MKINHLGSLLLCFTCLFLLIGTPTSASLNADATSDSIVISDRAGKHGSYYYDCDSGTETFIPSDSTLEDCEIFVDIPQSSLQEADRLPEEIDPELNEIVESFLAHENRAGDNRKPVAKPSGYELSTCLLGARFDDANVTHVESNNKCVTGVHTGTGWLINNNYLVTAGHMVYDWEHSNNGNDGWAKHVAIYVGASGNEKPVHYSLSSGYHVGGDYRACNSNQDYLSTGRFDDWAVIKLKSPVTTSIPKLTPKETNDYSEMLNKTYITQGYPQDLNSDKKSWDRFTMYKQTNCTIFGPIYPTPYTLDAVLSSNTNFDHGQSGSPIYRNGFVQGIGIGKFQTDTCFILINNWLYNKIYNEWM